MAINSPKLDRNFVAQDLTFSWDKIEPYYQQLLDRKIESTTHLKQWLKDRSELSSVLSEAFAWRYIRMNIDTDNETFQKEFQYFVQEINPKLAPFEDKLNKKLYSSPLKDSLKEKDYENLLKSCQTQIELFREENIPLFTQLEEEGQKFGAISAKMSIEYKGQEYTIQQAAKFLKSTNREERQDVYELIQKKKIKGERRIKQTF